MVRGRTGGGKRGGIGNVIPINIRQRTNRREGRHVGRLAGAVCGVNAVPDSDGSDDDGARRKGC